MINWTPISFCLATVAKVGILTLTKVAKVARVGILAKVATQRLLFERCVY